MNIWELLELPQFLFRFQETIHHPTLSPARVGFECIRVADTSTDLCYVLKDAITEISPSQWCSIYLSTPIPLIRA
jgi:hypothetical protein